LENGVLERNIGMLEYWNNGMMDEWSREKNSTTKARKEENTKKKWSFSCFIDFVLS
jgi:hypothetical protein